MRTHITTWYLKGLCCADEETLIRKSLQKVPGINSISFQTLDKTITVHHTCAKENITDILQHAGFSPRLRNQAQKPSGEQYEQLMIFTFSATLFIFGLICNFFTALNNFSVAMFLLSIAMGGWRIVFKAYGAIRQKHLDMNVLMAAAVFGAIVIGKWEEASAVVVLFSLSHLLEQYSVHRSRTALHSLLKLSPETATVIRSEKETNEHVENVNLGEKVIIRPGERIPIDGVVEDGISTVNQSPITGESAPVKKQRGDMVYAGSLNERGVLFITVTSRSTDTILARIIRLVEESQSNRAPIQLIAEKFSRYYTPSVLAVAVVVALVPPLVFGLSLYDWFYRALVLLVIACPCALIISTPVALFSALTNAAKHGVLIKNGRALEAVSTIKAIAFDKTGTLTNGTPRVTDIISFSSLSEQELLRLAATIEKQSEHHLASAVLRKANERTDIDVSPDYHSYESLPGRGAKVVVDGVEYYIGNRALFQDLNIFSAKVEKILNASSENSEVLVGTKENILGVLIIADDLRTESLYVVEKLRAECITPIMITGDGSAVARKIAAEATIQEFYAEVLPEQKAEKVVSLKKQYGSIGMVGDGINDAAAISNATVGIAMGKSGTDLAIETADIVLMSDDLRKIPFTIQISRSTISIIKQNIALALGTKALVLVLAMFGNATLWMGILADDGATLLVIMNSLRALLVKES